MQITLKLTASLHLKMDGWNTIVSFWDGLFSGVFAVSFRETSLTQEWIGNGIIVTIFAFNFNQRILVILHLRDWVRKHFNLISNMFRALMETNVFFTICFNSAWFGYMRGPVNFQQTDLATEFHEAQLEKFAASARVSSPRFNSPLGQIYTKMEEGGCVWRRKIWL